MEPGRAVRYDSMSNSEDQVPNRVTITEVAQLAGVSAATVSRVINGNSGVRLENVQKVQDVLESVGYSRSRDRRVAEETVTIGFVLPDISNPWFPSLIKGVERVTRLHDMNLVIADSENDPAIEKRNIDTMVARQVDGLILVPTNRHSESARSLVESGFPVVFLDRRIEDHEINFVTSNNGDGAYQATKYLLSLGHRDIVYIAGNDRIDTEWTRREGFEKALKEAGIPIQPELIVHGNYLLDDAETAVTNLIAHGVEFSAVFASDDMMAFGAKIALEKAGLRIPEDVSLIGFDNIVFGPLLGLTTVSQYPFELGKNAVLLLGDILSGRVTSPKTIELPTTLVIRNSCARASF